ncbi:MAG TPA: hypothetical protein VJH03_00040 [Blastocatellia bacterium]|nr:hypothetical protein [Blastocatellia bacterium]
MKYVVCAVISIAAAVACVPAAAAQESDPLVKRSDIFCTGFISEVAPRVDLQVVGGEKENLKSLFTEGDIVFLNGGRERGIQPGAVFYITRPMGEVKHPFTKKKVGHFVRELGLLRVIDVQDYVSTAEITVSCETISFGDLLKPYEEYTSPSPRDARPLPRYGESSGGVTGQIMMSPKLREYFSANEIVLIDLGERQGIRPGDYFTIYRKIGRTEGITNVRDDDVVQERSEGYGSIRYRGGDVSSIATRAPVEKVLRERPALPRKVLGELVVLKVQNTAAVALITRTNAEVNIGDWIERSN